MQQHRHLLDTRSVLFRPDFCGAADGIAWRPAIAQGGSSTRCARCMGRSGRAKSFCCAVGGSCELRRNWGADASACSVRLNRKGFLPAVINDEGAFAGDTSCAFKSRKQVAGAWQLVAACANARRRWTSHIRLAVTGNRLIWSSQRGLQTYVRCERGPMMAQASK